MKTLAIVLVATGLALTGCDNKSDSSKSPATNSTTSDVGNPITAPVDYLGAINRAQNVAVKTIDTVQIRKAIEFFNAQEDRFPKDLNELITKHYLPQLPKLPSGMTYDYDPKTGTLQVLKNQ